jgi:hypothetical protein
MGNPATPLIRVAGPTAAGLTPKLPSAETNALLRVTFVSPPIIFEVPACAKFGRSDMAKTAVVKVKVLNFIVFYDQLLGNLLPELG